MRDKTRHTYVNDLSTNATDGVVGLVEDHQLSFQIEVQAVPQMIGVVDCHVTLGRHVTGTLALQQLLHPGMHRTCEKRRCRRLALLLCWLCSRGRQCSHCSKMELRSSAPQHQ